MVLIESISQNNILQILFIVFAFMCVIALIINIVKKDKNTDNFLDFPITTTTKGDPLLYEFMLPYAISIRDFAYIV